MGDIKTKENRRLVEWDDIIIPTKPNKQPLSAQAWIAIVISVATFSLVVKRLINT